MKPPEVENAWAVAHGVILALETLAPHLVPAGRDALTGPRPPAKVGDWLEAARGRELWTVHRTFGRGELVRVPREPWVCGPRPFTLSRGVVRFGSSWRPLAELETLGSHPGSIVAASPWQIIVYAVA